MRQGAWAPHPEQSEDASKPHGVASVHPMDDIVHGAATGQAAGYLVSLHKHCDWQRYECDGCSRSFI